MASKNENSFQIFYDSNLKLFELKSGRGEKLMKNILIISSSPRKKGNSQILCEQFKKGAEAKGHQVKMVRIWSRI